MLNPKKEILVMDAEIEQLLAEIETKQVNAIPQPAVAVAKPAAPAQIAPEDNPAAGAGPAPDLSAQANVGMAKTLPAAEPAAKPITVGGIKFPQGVEGLVIPTVGGQPVAAAQPIVTPAAVAAPAVQVVAPPVTTPAPAVQIVTPIVTPTAQAPASAPVAPIVAPPVAPTPTQPPVQLPPAAAAPTVIKLPAAAAANDAAQPSDGRKEASTPQIVLPDTMLKQQAYGMLPPLKFDLDINDFRAKARITETNLDEIMQSQASDRAYYGALLAMAENQSASAKLAAEIYEAELFEKIRTRLLMAGEKATEATVNAQIRRDPLWQAMKQRHINADAIESKAKSCVMALSDRKDMAVQRAVERREGLKGQVRVTG